jgi:hypothetical protein
MCRASQLAPHPGEAVALSSFLAAARLRDASHSFEVDLLGAAGSNDNAIEG